MNRWFKYAKPYLPYFIIGPLCMIIEVIGEVLMPKFLALIVDYGLGQAPIEEAPAVIRWLLEKVDAPAYIIAIMVAMIITAILMMIGYGDNAFFDLDFGWSMIFKIIVLMLALFIFVPALNEGTVGIMVPVGVIFTVIVARIMYKKGML